VWELPTFPEHPSSSPMFNVLRHAQCIDVCRPFFVIMFFFRWPLYCLFIDLRLVMTPFGIFKFTYALVGISLRRNWSTYTLILVSCSYDKSTYWYGADVRFVLDTLLSGAQRIIPVYAGFNQIGLNGTFLSPIYVRENRRANQEWTIQKHWVYKTQDKG